MRLRALWLLLALAVAPVQAAPAATTPTIWDLQLGQPAAELPAGFVDFACGGNGGPPTTPLSGFAEFGKCPAERSGLHEVYFRYDDAADARREAWQLWPLARVEGTRVFGFRAMLSALFDEAGMLSGLRIHSDPRGVAAGERNDHWRLAAVLQAHYHEASWSCEDAPLRARETMAASFFIKRKCTGLAEGRRFSTAQDYFHKAGQGFVDVFGKVQNTYFVSDSRFEILLEGAGQAD